MRLQKAPRGVVGGFNLKHTGQNPPEFGDAVLPVTDVTDNYLIDLLGELNANVTIAGGSGVTTLTTVFTVPVGFSWRLLAIGGRWTVAAGDVAINSFVSVGVAYPNGVNYPLWAAQGIGAPTDRFAALTLAKPLFLPAGFGLNFTSLLSAAPASNLALACRALFNAIPE